MPHRPHQSDLGCNGPNGRPFPQVPTDQAITSIYAPFIIPQVYAKAEPFPQIVMRDILLQTSLIKTRGLTIGNWAIHLEKKLASEPLSTLNRKTYEDQIANFGLIWQMHKSHFSKELLALLLNYMEQVTMWALGCNKPKASWDMRFIERRKL